MGKVEFTCENCKTTFFDWLSQRKNTKKHFCSINCHNESMKTKLTNECKRCKKIFPVTLTDLKLGRGKYCSKECYDEDRLKISTCEFCGEIFKSLPSKMRRFCSAECSSKSQNKQVKRICLWCDIDFYTSIPTIKKGHGKFCSQSCRANYNIKYNSRYKNTSIEIAIEKELVKLGMKYKSQARIGRYLCDFYIPHLSLIIECDGDYWHSLPESIARDKRKDKWLKQNKYSIIRLSEKDIKNNPEQALLSKIPSLQLSLF